MKAIPSLILTFLAVSAFARSQDGPSGNAPDPGATITTARILGNIADGTPPPPSAPRPRFQPSSNEILRTTTHQQGGRTVTIQQIKPPPIPPVPDCRAGIPSEASSEAFRQKAEEFRASHPRSRFLFIGAAVYRSQDSPPRTLMRLHPEGRGETLELWSDMDMALVAGGINSYLADDGVPRHLIIGWSNIVVDNLARFFAAEDRPYAPPPPPEFTGGDATFHITRGQPSAADLAAIRSLHGIYNSNHGKLLAAWRGREDARLRREAWLRANPPQPRDIVLKYWRNSK